MKKSSLFKFFILLTLASSFLAYFSNSGLLAYGPMLVVAIFILFFEVVEPSLLTYKEWLVILAFLPYTLISEYYYFLNPYEGKLLTEYSITFVFIPFFIYVFLVLRRKCYGNDYGNFIIKIILIFLILQLIVCLGQISTYVFGLGFPVNQEYKYDFMISGTFNNSNDLAVVVLLISITVAKLESLLKKNIKFIIWFSIAFLLILSSSRAALFCTLFVFLFSRNINYRTVISLLLMLFAVVPIVGLVFSQNDNGVLNRISSRIETFQNIYENGLKADDSIGLRLDSYIHFVKNITNLGWGSGKLNNYYKFATNANFDGWLMFQNPHFLIVEIGYWSGWLGLISFLSAFIFLIFSYYRNTLFIFVAVISMAISSSVLGSSIYFFFLLLCMFSKLDRSNYQ